MGFKVHNLEHIDGKKVTHSTITSQRPEVFVKRKKNTGELIITSDTVTDYGMHHIYLGGEHIAGGYGFATVKTRDDLCYVQESYTGIFDYFNQAYTYHTLAYSSLNNYVQNAYIYTNSSIKYNSYTNVNVDNKLNKLETCNDTYTFAFNNGVLTVSGKDIQEITVNAVLSNHDIQYTKDNTTYVLLSSLDYYNSYALYTATLNGNANAKYFNRTVSITTNNNTSYVFSYKNVQSVSANITGYEFVLPSAGGTTNSTWVDENIKSVQESGKYYLPIFVDIPETYTYAVYNTHNTENNYTNILTFKFVNPILYGTLSKTEMTYSDNIKYLQNKNQLLLDTDTYTSAYMVLNSNKVSEYNTDNYTYLFVAIDSKYYTDFYMSTDISKRGNCEGGFTMTSTVEINSSKYNVYLSEPQYFDREMRVDIDINK